MAVQPDFKVSDSEKQKLEWYKNTIDWLINRAVSDNNKSKTLDALKVANGIIDTSDFKKVMQPFGNAPDETKNLPGEIRNLDFVTPIREKNMGEYIILPYKFFVTVENPDVVLKNNSEVSQEVFKEMQKLLVEYIKSLTQGQGQGEIDPDVIKEKAEALKQKFFDDKVIESQHILNYINTENNFEYQRLSAFSDWWCTEEVYFKRTIINGKVIKEKLDVTACYPIRNNSDFVEDYEGFVYKKRITFQEFEQFYADKLTKKEYEYLKSISYNSIDKGYSVNVNLLMDRNNMDTFINSSSGRVYLGSDSMDLWCIEFVAPSLQYELTYVNQLGEVDKLLVGNDYKLNEENGDIEINKIWIPKTYEALRFGNDLSGVYVVPEPTLVQRYDKETNNIKLSYGGKQGLLQGININPIPARLKDFVIIDRILMLQIERTIAKYKSDITAIPQSMLNDDKAGTMVQKYQHLMADNVLIYDDTKIDQQTLANGFRNLAMNSVSQYLDSLWRIRQMNKQDAWDISNMNSERLGNAPTDQTATGTQNNLMYAKLGSILMVTIFNMILEREHIADLEFSKYAFINGKKATFFDRETEQYIELDIDPYVHYFNKYGVSVSNAKIHDDIMSEFKRLAFSAAQNGDFKMASVAITATTPKEIARTIDLIANAKEQFEQSLETQKLQLQQASIKEQAQLREDKNTIEANKNATDIKVAEIQAGAKITTGSMTANKNLQQ